MERQNRSRTFLILCFCFLMSVSVAAQRNLTRVAQSVHAPVQSRAQISGYLWNSNNGILAHATVRIRSLTTCVVVQTVETDEYGVFRFVDLRPDDYIIEHVGSLGVTLAAGLPFSLNAGDSVVTFLRTSGGVAGMLPKVLGHITSSIASAAMHSAASQGIPSLATWRGEYDIPVVSPIR